MRRSALACSRPAVGTPRPPGWSALDCPAPSLAVLVIAGVLISRPQGGAGHSRQCTQTAAPMGMRPSAQIQSMAALLTRTQPWEAG